jgi:hypothetical protein
MSQATGLDDASPAGPVDIIGGDDPAIIGGTVAVGVAADVTAALLDGALWHAESSIAPASTKT